MCIAYTSRRTLARSAERSARSSVSIRRRLTCVTEMPTMLHRPESVVPEAHLSRFQPQAPLPQPMLPLSPSSDQYPVRHSLWCPISTTSSTPGLELPCCPCGSSRLPPGHAAGHHHSSEKEAHNQVPAPPGPTSRSDQAHPPSHGRVDRVTSRQVSEQGRMTASERF